MKLKKMRERHLIEFSITNESVKVIYPDEIDHSTKKQQEIMHKARIDFRNLYFRDISTREVFYQQVCDKINENKLNVSIGATLNSNKGKIIIENLSFLSPVKQDIDKVIVFLEKVIESNKLNYTIEKN